MNKKMLSGSFWLSFGSIFSKALGVVYLIPWLSMMGSEHNINTAQALFNSTYNIYAIFLSLGMAGFPSAIARRIAIYNSKNEFLNSKKIFKAGLLLMGLSGIIFAILLYLLAPLFAKNSPVVSQENSIIAIRSMAPAIVLLPSMSIVRGWFQGNQDLKPFGISQLWEQLFRIIFILLSTYILIYKLNLNYVVAVYFSVFAAFIGTIASYLYLIFHFKNKIPEYRQLEKHSEEATLENVNKMFLMIGYEAIPFVVVGAGINLCQIIDQLFFKQIMQGTLNFTAEYTQNIYTAFSANPSKITAVIISLATAVAESSLPLLAAKNAAHDQYATQDLLLQNFKYLLFILLPLATVLGVLSPQINGLFFFFSQKGANFLFLNIWQSVFMSIAINGLTLLQSLHYSRKAMIYLIIGLFTKLILQFPLVYFFQGTGAIIATTLAFLIVCALAYGKIKEQFSIRLNGLFPIISLNFIYFEVIMLFAIFIPQIYAPDTKLTALLYSCLVGGIMLILYLLVAKKVGLIKQIFSEH